MKCFSCFCDAKHSDRGCPECRCDVQPGSERTPTSRDCRDCVFFEEHSVSRNVEVYLRDVSSGEVKLDSAQGTLQHCSLGNWEAWVKKLSQPAGLGRPPANLFISQAGLCADFVKNEKKFDNSKFCVKCEAKGVTSREGALLCHKHAQEVDRACRALRLSGRRAGPS